MIELVDARPHGDRTRSKTRYWPPLYQKPVSLELNYSEEYRFELARAFSEVYLIHDSGPVLSIMDHRPLRDFIDPAKVHKARHACNGEDLLSHIVLSSFTQVRVAFAPSTRCK
jgi:hypothetical protein